MVLLIEIERRQIAGWMRHVTVARRWQLAFPRWQRQFPCAPRKAFCVGLRGEASNATGHVNPSFISRSAQLLEKSYASIGATRSNCAWAQLAWSKQTLAATRQWLWKRRSMRFVY
jgi:hypothetical protein